MLRPKNDKRLVRMFFIIQIFDAYTQRNLYKECLSQKTDKNKSIETSEMVNKLFGMKTTPDDFINDENDLANKAIKYNNIMQELLNIACEVPQLDISIIEKLIKRMEFENKPILIKSRHLLLTNLITNYTLYNRKKITQKDFLEELQFLKNLKFPLSQMRIKFDLFMLKEIEKMYLEIEAKKTSRLQKKILEI